jgi:DNA-binding transcriptional ArsR family regulator
MPRVCTVCSHPQRPEIDRALVAGELSFRNIAERFGTSPTALTRHKKEHVPVSLAKAQEAAATADADDLLQQIKDLRNRALAILGKAEQSGDYRTALMGIREARACVETLMEVEGELDRRSTVNVVVSPDWQRLRSVIFVTLQSYPDARLAIAEQLIQIESGEPYVAD